MGVPGGRNGASGNAPASEVVQLFGADNLMVLVEALHNDQATWYRHDPSVASWLLSELGSAYGYMREQAHRNDPLFQDSVFEDIAALVLQRQYAALKTYRDDWIASLRRARGVYNPGFDAAGRSLDRPEPLDVLSFALIVQSVFLDRQIKYDMEVMAQRKGCGCGNPWGLTFYDLYPTAPDDVERYNRARAAFAAYVECKWPIHIFAVDPSIDQQNELDLFSQRTQLQLALAVAVASGSVNFQNATSYARRVELDLETVALNRTIVGFGAGDTTFGWQFYPRVQTPPLQNNLQRVAGILINNGPGPEYGLKNSRIEPGPRECYALVVMPNFVPSIKLTSVTNWFDLKTKHAEQELETTDMVRLGKRLQAAKHGLQHVCDTGQYRPEEVELLADRIGQLEDMLPVKGHTIDLPFEGSLLGSEMFSSNAAGLAPRLLAWYGEPPLEGADSAIFLLGNGFCVNEIHVIAGGLHLPDANFDVISRNVMRVTIPAASRTVKTHLKVDGIERKLIDVHVASPNGISNHLLVEIQPAPAVTATAAVGGFTVAPDKNSVDVSYALLPMPDGKSYVPVYLGVAADAQVDLTWDMAVGIAPATVNASFEFPDPRGAGFGTLALTLQRIEGKGKTYAITNGPGAALDTLAGTLFAGLSARGLFAPDKPAIALQSNKITLTPDPAPGGLVVRAEPVSGPVTVNFKLASVAARIDPAAVQITLNPDPSKLAADKDLTIDWLGAAPQVRANVQVELTSNGVLVGTLTFADSPAVPDVVFSGGKRVIKKEIFAKRLGEMLAQPGAVKPVDKGVFKASLITLAPRVDGLGLAPIPVVNRFEIDFVAPAKPAGAAYVAPRAGFPTARRAAPRRGRPSPRPPARRPRPPVATPRCGGPRPRISRPCRPRPPRPSPRPGRASCGD